MRKIAIAAITLLALVPTASIAREFDNFTVGNWAGSAYIDDRTNSFAFCGIRASYANGTTLFLHMEADYSLSLGFLNQAWNLQPGTDMAGVLRIDDRYSASFVGRVATPKGVQVRFLAQDPIFEHVRRGQQMSIVSALGGLQYQLSDTARALDMVKACVDKYRVLVRPNAEATNWRSRNAWYNTPQFAAQTEIVWQIDEALRREGLDPFTRAFYDELDKRLREKGITPGTGAAIAPQVANVTQPVPQQEPEYQWVSGSGFVVSTDGHIVTNYHVLDGCVAPVMVLAPGGARFEGEAIAGDPTNDMALVRSGFRSAIVATIRAPLLRTGEPITVAGFPLAGYLASDLIVTNGIVNALGGIGDDTRFVQISAPVQNGNSGGPLFDDRGSVAGIVTAGVPDLELAKQTGAVPQNINFAIKASLIRDFLEKNRVPFRVGQNTPTLTTVQIADRAREFTVQLTCRVPAQPVQDPQASRR